MYKLHAQLNKQHLEFSEKVPAKGHNVLSQAQHLLENTISNPVGHWEVILAGVIIGYLIIRIISTISALSLQAAMPAVKPSYGHAPSMGLAKPVITIGSFAAYYLGAQAFISPFLEQGLKAVLTICGGAGS